MNENSKSSKVKEQLDQLHGNVSRVDTALNDLSETLIFACTPEEPRSTEGVTVKPSPDYSADAPLVGILRDVNDQIFILMRRIANINERLEL